MVATVLNDDDDDDENPEVRIEYVLYCSFIYMLYSTFELMNDKGKNCRTKKQTGLLL